MTVTLCVFHYLENYKFDNSLKKNLLKHLNKKTSQKRKLFWDVTKLKAKTKQY